MTCIVGLIENGITWMGADSLCELLTTLKGSGF